MALTNLNLYIFQHSTSFSKKWAGYFELEEAYSIRSAHRRVCDNKSNGIVLPVT